MQKSKTMRTLFNDALHVVIDAQRKIPRTTNNYAVNKHIAILKIALVKCQTEEADSEVDSESLWALEDSSELSESIASLAPST